MRVGRRRQRRVAVSHRIITQRVGVDIGAIVATSDIHNGAIAHRKRSASIIRQRCLYRPTGSQLFVDISRKDGGVVSARSHNAAIVYCSSVEPHPGHVNVWSAAPSVAAGVVDLRDGGKRGKRSPASEQVDLPVEHRAAGPCHWRRHRRAAAPTVSRDIVDLQVGHFAESGVTAGNV